jgi:hypothetical protein
MSFLLSIFTFINILTIRIEWFYTEIIVQLKDNIEHYLMIPEAKLYVDDVWIENPLVFYERDGVERTFKSTINTNVTRDYILKYRVTFSAYYVSSVQSITFQVVDEVPPIIDQLPSFLLPVGQKLPLLSEGLLYHDNYDSILNISVSIDSSSVVLTRTGTYPIIYQIRDGSGNLTEKTSTLTIYDHLPPEITVKKEIQIPYGESLSWRDFFTVKDNYDLVLSVKIDDQYIDYQHLGVYPFSITATDSSGLSTVLFQEVTITDLDPPTILLKSLPAPLSVGSDVSDIDFSSYIVSIMDNYDQLDIFDVTFHHDIEIDVVGAYRIYYMVIDHSGNITEEELIIKVSDLEAPDITINIPFIYQVFDSDPHLINQFSYSDNYSRMEEMTCKITATYKMNVVGDYPITIEVTDRAGNKTIYRGYIEVKDVYAPVITQLNDIIITDFEQKDLTFYFSTTDNYDPASKITISIDDSNVDYEKIGSYVIDVEAIDQSGNVKMMETEVIVIDIIQPVLTLSIKALTVEVGTTPLDLTRYIEEATDNYDDLDKNAVLITESIDYEVLGVYPVIYLLRDSSLNVTELTLYLSVDDRTPPVVEFTRLSLLTHSIFNPLEGVQVNEQSNSYTIQYFPYLLDTSIPGNKTITYIITDDRGNYTVSNRIIEIIPESDSPSLISFLPVVLITLIGAGASYYFWKRM